jgi:3-oxoacyl-[acyl-carrier protein] reductase
MSFDFSGKVVLVTGASRGIGAAIADFFGRSGATLVGTATSEQGVAAIQSRWLENQWKGKAYVLDVSQPEKIDAFFSQLQSDDLMPNVLVNNAGITRDNLMLRMKDTEWHEVINTNLNGVFYLTKACLRNMIKQRYGRIISVSSVVASMGNAGQCNYAAAKAGLLGFSKSLAKEVATRNITVNVVSPGFIETDMTNLLDEKQREAISAQVPMGRLGQAEEIAAAVAFLASNYAAYITGENLPVNGGMWMP